MQVLEKIMKHLSGFLQITNLRCYSLLVAPCGPTVEIQIEHGAIAASAEDIPTKRASGWDADLDKYWHRPLLSTIYIVACRFKKQHIELFTLRSRDNCWSSWIKTFGSKVQSSVHNPGNEHPCLYMIGTWIPKVLCLSMYLCIKKQDIHMTTY